MSIVQPTELRWLSLSGGGLILLALVAQGSMAIGTQGIPVLGVFLQREFGLTRAELGLLVAMTQVGACISMFIGGWLADTLGVRRTLALGLGLVSVALLGLTTANALLIALPFVFLSGSGNGIANPAVSLAILHRLPLHVRGMAMSLKQTGVPLAGIVLAAGLTPLAEALGWRAAALLAGAAVLGMSALWFAVYRDVPKVRPATRRPTLHAAGALLRHPGFLSMSAFGMAGVAAQFCMLGYLILFLHEGRGFSIVLAGQVLAMAQLGGLLGRIAWGLTSDRLLRGARKPALCIAGGLGALALAAVALLPLQSPVLAFATVAVLGLTLLAWHGLHPVAVAELVGTERAGQAIGLSLSMNQLGAIAAPPLFGLLVDRTGSYELAWLALAAALATSVAAMAFGWRERHAL